MATQALAGRRATEFAGQRAEGQAAQPREGVLLRQDLAGQPVLFLQALLPVVLGGRMGEQAIGQQPLPLRMGRPVAGAAGRIVRQRVRCRQVEQCQELRQRQEEQRAFFDQRLRQRNVSIGSHDKVIPLADLLPVRRQGKRWRRHWAV